MEKICKKCKINKELNSDNFPKKKTSKMGFDSMCKQCKNEYDRERYAKKRDKLLEDKKVYYKKNKKKILARQGEYYQKNRDSCIESNKKWSDNNQVRRRVLCEKSRTKKHGADSTLTEKEWLLIKSYFFDSCAYCGIDEDAYFKLSGEKLHHEHIVPLIKKGSYSFGNIVPSCRSCNSSKMNENFRDWYKNYKFYDELREKKIISYMNKQIKSGVDNV